MACAERGENGSDAAAAASGAGGRFHLADAVAEWRSREQLEPSVPSTSPGYWDSDDDDASALSSLPGPKPADLYGKFTWKIENFSEISKRELRSNVFEVGGYKWYILVYPQGCDVCNHLSLFLCVADYDKLLPGWSHFAQFTIAVVNKDPKKSKYSDTLHRFCKKEHDWGWKKFMELSKVLDGFTVGDTLVIKAQVQVIRENPHRPFRCLDCQYRRELVRVYLTNVEGICRRFVEEKREKLGKVIEDTLRWSSFRAFWLAVEDNARRRLAREKTDIIFKAVVKRFFNEKEVTSTLVMDALYSGCKALDYQNKTKKHKTEAGEEAFTPVVWMEKDFFVLAGDILSLLERAVLDPLPSYKDDKGPQNRTKDGTSGDEFGKEFVERDERRLTELGRRTVEMFVLSHLFSNRIEVAYREAVALKRQEELIREEEAAGQAESELKAKREAAEREKRTKKKQAKQRRKDRKGKDKDAVEKRLNQEQLQDLHSGRLVTKQILLTDSELSSLLLTETGDEEGDSGLDMVDNVVGTLGPAAEDLERATWEREASLEMEASFSGSLSEGASGQSKRLPTALDDSSSTCSSDSLPSVRPTTSNSFSSRANTSDQGHVFMRGRNRAVVDGFDSDGRLIEGEGVLRTVVSDTRNTGETSSSCSSGAVDAEAVILSFKERVRWLEKRLQEKEEEVVLLHEQLSLLQHKVGDQARNQKSRSGEVADYRFALASCETGSNSFSNNRNGSISQVSNNDGELVQKGRTSKSDNRQSKSSKFSTVNGCHNTLWPTENGHHANEVVSRGGSGASSRSRSVESSNPVKAAAQKSDNEMAGDSRMAAAAMPMFSRPSSAPILANGPRPSILLPVLQSMPPPLARSVSAASRLNAGVEPTVETVDSLVRQNPPLSYRNAAVGKLHSSGAGMSHSLQNSSDRLVNGGTFVRPYVGATSSSASNSASTSSMSTMSSPSKLPVVYEQSHPLKGDETVTSVSDVTDSGTPQKSASNQQNGGDESMAITFGTITQEVLHSEHQHQLVEDDLAVRVDEQPEMHHEHEHNGNCSSSGDSTSGTTSVQQTTPMASFAENGNSSSSLLSEDFPHLDIINDLLDDDKNLGRALSAILHPGRDYLNHHSSNGEGSEKQHRLVMSANERESSQLMASYGHAPSMHSEAGTGIPARFWPLSRSLSANGVSFNAGPDAQNRYPLVQGHHVLVPDCSRVPLGHDGYSVYAPLQ